MAFHRCCIQHESGDIIAEDVSLTIEETTYEGTSKWYGTISITHLTDLPAGKRYRLVLDDGRAGEFLVRRNTFAGGVGGADRAVAIHGTGPLE
jgi:hypothetical protein